MKRMARQILAIVGIVTLFLAVGACSTHQSVTSTYGFQGNPNGNWGSSISFGVHSHGRGW